MKRFPNLYVICPMIGDLFHYGHINLLKKCKTDFEKVYVLLRTDKLCFKQFNRLHL